MRNSAATRLHLVSHSIGSDTIAETNPRLYGEPTSAWTDDGSDHRGGELMTPATQPERLIITVAAGDVCQHCKPDPLSPSNARRDSITHLHCSSIAHHAART